MSRRTADVTRTEAGCPYPSKRRRTLDAASSPPPIPSSSAESPNLLRRVIAVVDTNAFIIPAEFCAIRWLGRHAISTRLLLLVPQAVQTELQGIAGVPSSSPGLVDGRPRSRAAAAQALEWLEEQRLCTDTEWLRLQNPCEQWEADTRHSSGTLRADDSILACCRWHHTGQNDECETVLLSGDAVLTIKAFAHGVRCQDASTLAATPSLKLAPAPSSPPWTPQRQLGRPTTTPLVALLHPTVLLDTEQLMALSALLPTAEAGALILVIPPSTLATLDTLKTDDGPRGFQAR